MQFINRSIAIIKPKQPFVDWINSTDPDSGRKISLEQASSDPTCILLPEFDSPKGARSYIKRIYDDVWLWELMAWWTDESVYPKKRSFEKFYEWFDIELGSEVFDWLNKPIEKEEV